MKIHATRAGAGEAAPNLKITGLVARPVVVPYARPIQTAFGAMPEAAFVLVDLETDDDIRGSSYVRCYGRIAQQPVVEVLRGLENLVVGERLAPLELWVKLRSQFRLLGVEGVIGLALNALDMAAWDALARSMNLPLVRLLGSQTKAVRAYMSLRSISLEDALRETDEARALGFDAVKVKVGMSSAAEEYELLEALGDRMGASTGVMCDYNQSLTLTEALAHLRIIDELGLRWVEEPLPAADLEGLSRLANAVRTPIQAGESWWSPEEAARSVRAHASDLVMLDVARVGGVTGWLRAAAIAESAGLKVSSHTFPEFSVHLLAAAPNADLLEWLDSAAPLCTDPLLISDGSLHAPETPGAGITWDENAVERFRVG